MDESKEAVSSRYNRTDAYLSTQRLVALQVLHGFIQDGVPVLKGGWRHVLLPLTKSCLQMIPTGKGKSAFSNGVLLGILNNTKGQVLCPGVAGQSKQTHGIFCRFFLYCFALLGHFLSYLSLACLF